MPSSLTRLWAISIRANWLVRILTIVATLLVAAPGRAQASSDNENENASAAQPLPWKIGPAPLSLPHDVRIELPAGYQFLAQPEAGQLMEKMGNLHNENLLGLVAGARDEEDYLVIVRFDDEGFVKDDEKLDANEILKSLREGEDEYNEERKKLGFGPIHADGWLEIPNYDRAQHRLVWGLLVSEPGSTEGASVNFNTRVLGRRGFVSVNLITDKERLPIHRHVASELLAVTTFAAGARYEDFDKKTDKVAEYGLTGLVLGGAGFGLAKAVKIGLLAKFWKAILALLIAGKKFIVVALAAGAGILKKLFGKKADADAPPVT